MDFILFFFLLPLYFSDYSGFQIIPQNLIKLAIKLGFAELLTPKRERKISICYIASVLEALEPDYIHSPEGSLRGIQARLLEVE